MALLPPFFLDTVVAIGEGHDPETRRWIGTGFIYGSVIDPSVEEQKRKYWLWLITNKHVLTALKEIYVKFNSATEPNSRDYRVGLVAKNGKKLWVGHPDEKTDVAAIYVHAGFLTEEKRRFEVILSDKHTCTKAKMKTGWLSEGDRVFVLGFPMGLVSADRQYVICRSGIVGRIRDYLDDKATDFLVDAPAFPGNSGGPVISCPAALSIQGTAAPETADLIGIVKSYVPYTDVAISAQTKRPRITFEENSGLTAVEPVDAVIATANLALKRIKNRAYQAKFQSKKRTQTQATEHVPPAREPEARPVRRR
jgi:Trypsin-like peptidase domain